MVSAAAVIIALLGAKLLAQLWLERLNTLEVRKNSPQIPAAFVGAIDGATYAKAVDYTLAKGRFGRKQVVFDALVLGIVLLSGLLPELYFVFNAQFGAGILAQAAFLFVVGVILSIPSLPWDWVEQFRLEERFGFNTSNQKTWWSDRAKGLLLSLVLGYPLLLLVLKLVDWMGDWWWLWAWASVLGFQLLMVLLAPILIMPLFNKFTPLPEGPLRDRLLRLGERTGFQSKTIQVMDGSKRSRHSNAFFTGVGNFRKIVLFDTLINQLAEVELEAVLAHEIGHYKKKHIPKMLIGSALGLLVAFFTIAQLAKQPWFYGAFGFGPGSIVPALLLFSLLSGVVTFWFTPLFNLLSRKFEYEADAYAAGTMSAPEPLIGALRKLNEKNLSNLTPHPLYSGFYYSHPTLLEREQALRALAA
ncbi:MAG: M48 family metallopeptidase [Limisphaerales bacterium]